VLGTLSDVQIDLISFLVFNRVDIGFCEKLIKVTKPLLLSPSVVTDERKFLKMGVWRSFLRVLLIILHVEFRLPVLPRAFFQDVR
jgi:hypothetical protein